MEKYISARKILFLKFSTIFAFFIIWLILLLFFKLKKKKGLFFVIFFSAFYFYIFSVLNYTLFEFQSLLILKHFIPNLILAGEPAEKSLNLIPLATLGKGDIKTSLLNILLFIPFGFGLPLISRFRLKNIVILGFIFSLIIELMQFLTGYIAGITFRVADINDVIFNTLGTVVGIFLFKIFKIISRNYLLGNTKN